MLSETLTNEIRDRAAQWRTTTGALVLAAVALVMARRTGRDDVLCGITVAGRPTDLPDADSMVGSFVNNLPARLTLQRDRAVDDWVRHIQRAQARREMHGHVAISDIHAWSELPAARPLFDSLVLLNLTDDSDLPWPGITMTPVSATLDAAYPLLLSVTMEGGRLALTAVHGNALSEPRGLLADLDAALTRLASAGAGARVAHVADNTPVTVESRPATGHDHGKGESPGARPLNEASASALANALLDAWREILDVDAIGLDDDFFALGGTSLQAARLFARIERLTGRTLPLSTLFGAGSVRALLAAIDEPTPRRGCIVRLRTAGRQPPVYAIPGIGGNVVGLAALARALGPDQPFAALESPGLDGSEAPLDSIDAIAERYAREIAADAPREFTLLGLCWGAAVVAEVTRKLAANGHAPNGIALIDPTSILRDSEARYDQDDVGFLKSRLALYWDEFREGDWSDRTRLLASKARRATQLAVGRAERKKTEVELRQFRVMEANKNAVIQYIPTTLEVRARLFLTRYRGEGDDPRLEWFSIIEPVPDVVAVDGQNAGDAIAPAHATTLAESLGTWLRALAGGRGMNPAGVSRPRLAFAGQLVATLAMFRILDVVIRRLGQRPVIAYDEVGRWWQLASSRVPWWFVAVLVAVVGLSLVIDARRFGGVAWRRVRALISGWDAVDDGHSLRWLVVGVTGVAAWALSCYSRNLFLDTWNIADRLLIVALWLAIAWRPIFVLPFALAGAAMAGQFLIPLGFISWTEMGVILRFPILFGAFWIVIVLARRRESDLFVFAWACLLAATYWTSGLGKLRVGWLTHPHVHFLLVGAYANGWLAGIEPRVIERAARWVASLAYPLMAFTLIVECGSLVMLWRRWSLVGFFVLAAAFHLGAFAMTGIFFWKWMLVDAVLLVYLLRGQRLARLAIFTPPTFALSVVAILASPLWVPSENLTWFDTPLTYVLELQAVDANGASHLLPAGFFRPYGDAIVLGVAGATPPHPKLTRAMGVTMDRSLAEALEAARSPDSVLAIEKTWAPTSVDSAASRTLDDFIATYAAHARCATERDPLLLRAVGIPRHLWTLPLDAALPCGVPIERIRMVERTVYYDGDHLRTIREIMLREVAVRRSDRFGRP